MITKAGVSVHASDSSVMIVEPEENTGPVRLEFGFIGVFNFVLEKCKDYLGENGEHWTTGIGPNGPVIEIFDSRRANEFKSQINRFLQQCVDDMAKN